MIFAGLVRQCTSRTKVQWQMMTFFWSSKDVANHSITSNNISCLRKETALIESQSRDELLASNGEQRPLSQVACQARDSLSSNRWRCKAANARDSRGRCLLSLSGLNHQIYSELDSSNWPIASSALAACGALLPFIHSRDWSIGTCQPPNIIRVSAPMVIEGNARDAAETRDS